MLTLRNLKSYEIKLRICNSQDLNFLATELALIVLGTQHKHAEILEQVSQTY